MPHGLNKNNSRLCRIFLLIYPKVEADYNPLQCYNFDCFVYRLMNETFGRQQILSNYVLYLAFVSLDTLKVRKKANTYSWDTGELLHVVHIRMDEVHFPDRSMKCHLNSITQLCLFCKALPDNLGEEEI